MTAASALTGLYARTFVIGLAVAAPVGAMGVLCIQRTLVRGARAGLATGLGVATADGIYAALAAFGVAALSSALVAWQTPLRLAGGAVLIAIGLRAAFGRADAGDIPMPSPAAAPSPEPATALAGAPPPTPAPAGAQRAEPGRYAALYASAVGLTLTNPMTIMAFGAIFASAGLSAQTGPAAAAVATLGVVSGSLIWWIILVVGVSLARGVVPSALLASINVVSGIIVAAFGVLAIGSVCLR